MKCIYLIATFLLLAHESRPYPGKPGQSTPAVTIPTLRVASPSPVKPTTTTVPIAKAAIPYDDDDAVASPDAYIVHIPGAKRKLPDETTFIKTYLPGCKITGYTVLKSANSVAFRVVGECKVQPRKDMTIYQDIADKPELPKRLQRRGFSSLYPLSETGMADTTESTTVMVDGEALDGAGVHVGVVDNGFDLDHYAFKATKLITIEEQPPVVKRRHGTMVLSMLAGQWDNSEAGDMRDWFKGISPGSTFALADLDSVEGRFGRKTLSLYDNLSRVPHLDVLTTSMGVTKHYYAPLMHEISQSIQDVGIVFVASAGNDGKTNMFNMYPWASLPSVLAVGSAVNPRQYTYAMKITSNKIPLYEEKYYGSIKFKGGYAPYPLYKTIDEYTTALSNASPVGRTPLEPVVTAFVAMACTVLDDAATLARVETDMATNPKLMLLLYSCTEVHMTKVQAHEQLKSRVITIYQPLQLKDAMTITFKNTPYTYQVRDEKMYMDETSDYGLGMNFCVKPDLVGIGGIVNVATFDNHISQVAGTSFAAPYVAGMVALFLQYVKGKQLLDDIPIQKRAETVRNVLMLAASPLKLTEKVKRNFLPSAFHQGNGLVNLKDAIHALPYKHIPARTNIAPCKATQACRWDAQLAFDATSFVATHKPAETIHIRWGTGAKIFKDPMATVQITKADTAVQLNCDLTNLKAAVGDDYPIVLYSGFVELKRGDQRLYSSYGGVLYRNDFNLFFPTATLANSPKRLVVSLTRQQVVLMAFQPFDRISVQAQNADGTLFGTLLEMKNDYAKERTITVPGLYMYADWKGTVRNSENAKISKETLTGKAFTLVVQVYSPGEPDPAKVVLNGDYAFA